MARTAAPTPRRFIPREGFHADVLNRIIAQTFFNPIVILPLLAAAKFTDRGREIASEYTGVLKSLNVLGTLGVCRWINQWLSRRAVNNASTDEYDWAKEVVLVTGGSDGIGKRIVQMLADKGIAVVVLDIQELTYSAPPTVTFHRCDITSTDSITKVAAEIQGSIGSPTVLINNAGVCRGKALLENTDSDLNLTFGVNTIAHYKLARAFLPAMIKANHGMVVTVASSAAWITAPKMTEYAASKAAAMAFHEGLAAELVCTYKAPKVRTVLVNQGYTKTSLFQGFGVKDGFVAPALHVDTVAEAIVNQVLRGESGQIIEPELYRGLPAHFRSLPDWLAYPARAGMDNLMRNWQGRQVDSTGSVVEKA